MDKIKKLKILMVAPTPFFADRGTHIRILEEALALEKRGHKIIIATYHIGSELPKSLNTKVDIRRIRRWLFWYKKLEAGPDWQKIILDIMLIKKVFYLARTQKPDILHAHLHEGVLIAWLVQKFLWWRKIKLVADFHGSLTKEMVSHAYLRGGILKFIFRKIEMIIDNLGDVAVASSWDNADEIAGLRKDKKTEVLLDGVNLRYYEKLPPKNNLRKKWNISQDKIVAVYTGALIPNKGVKLLFDAMPVVLKSNQDVYFVIAGAPVDQLKKYACFNKYKEHIKIISPLSYFSLPEILGLSDIAIDPKEAFIKQASGKILQYMGAGLPIACFDTQNNREYLGESSLFADEISASGLAKAINILAQDTEKRKKLGIIARQRAQQFSWDISTTKLENLIT